MPLFEYACKKCGKHFDRIEKFSSATVKKCPSCGGRAERMASAPAIQFKGSGWYVTDYARSSSGGKSEKSEKGESGAPAEKSESKTEAKSDGKTPAPAKESKESKKTVAKDTKK